MSKLTAIKLLAGAFLVSASMNVSAFAQDVLVVNSAKVFQTSRAGEDMRTKVSQIENSMKSELQPEATALETEGKSLAPQLQGKTEQTIQQDPALTSRVQAFGRKQQTFAQKREVRAGELMMTERVAKANFAKALSDAIIAVSTRRNAKVVLDASTMLYIAPGVDVTDEVVSEMNAKTPTIVVTRQKLPPRQTAPAQ